MDNRFGEANPIPLVLEIPGGMIADVDGAALRAAMGTTGRVQIASAATYEDIATGRSGIVTSFSSAGPTAFGAPAQARRRGAGRADPLLHAAGVRAARRSPSSTARAWRRRTSPARPRCSSSGIPTWSTQQVKSALMSTAGPSWGNTERTQEAAVTLEGAGLINVARADSPQIFTNPASLSLGELDITGGAASRGTHPADHRRRRRRRRRGRCRCRRRAPRPGTSIAIPSLAVLAPGGEVDLPVTAHAAPTATPGDDMGFIVLTKGAVSRRIPYYFEVSQAGARRTCRRPS